ELFLGYERSHLGIFGQAWAELDLFRAFSDARDDIVKNVALDHQARAGTTALAVIEEDRVGGPVNGRCEVGRILEDDVGRFAAQLKADLRQISCCGADDELAELSRGGDGNVVEIVV